jgi:hypothetical protein
MSIKTITHEQAFQAVQAFIEIMDGTTAEDIRFITGLSLDRCERMVDIFSEITSELK